MCAEDAGKETDRIEMQTFLPYNTYAESARCLDPSRLGNQAYRECKTLVNGGWRNHPASKMWRGYERELCLYALACLTELMVRGRYYPTHIEFFKNKMKMFADRGKPAWLGDERLHASHRSNLLRKNKEYYSQFGWKEPDNLEYYWPIERVT